MPPLINLFLRIVVFFVIGFANYRFWTTSDRKNNYNVGLVAIGLLVFLFLSGYWMVVGFKILFNI